MQVESAALENADEVLESGEPVQQHCTGTIVRRHLHAVHVAADRGSEQTRRPSEAGTYVEHAVPGLDLRQLQQFPRCAQAARVEVIQRPQLLRGQASLGIQTGGTDAGKDSRFDAIGRIVCRQAGCRHESPSGPLAGSVLFCYG